jgi:hypothetical protein
MTEIPSPTSDATGPSGSVPFGYHVVALIDLLGQTSELAKWDYLPDKESEKLAFIEAVRASYGRVILWRKQFEERFGEWLDGRKLSEDKASRLPDHGKAYQKFSETTIQFLHFSDTIIAHSPLTNKSGCLNLWGVGGFLFTSGVLMLHALNEKTAFRAGIEIGMAGCFPDVPLYGPALASAHFLENKIAQYPRIVVGKKLVSYLQAHRQNAENNAPAQANKGTADLCLGWLSRDDDAHWFVDYLGDGFASVITRPEGWEKLRRGAAEFVIRELQRFKKEKDEKLVSRYEQLAAYFQARGLS